ncbi:MAG: ribose-phosphate pyrophosphokinase [Planctomycetes bacterium]|nr:ribose-phosphate pyrophosphokinase [Planctomycetota bacterium]
MRFHEYQGDPEFRSWLERFVGDKIQEELDHERKRQFLESFAIVAVRQACPLATAIARHLGKALIRHEIVVFGDGEKKTVIHENLRGKTVVVVATVGDGEDPDVSLANTCKIVSTLRRTCKVSQINVVAPCLWYQAQDKTHARREPISVRDVADDLIRRGMSHIMVVELHAEQIEIAFDSFDHLKMAPIFGDYLSRRFRGERQNIVLIAPDDGGVRTREELYKNISPDLIGGQASVHQLRKRGSIDEKEIKDFVGDVGGKIAIIYDDMMRSGTTMFQAAAAAKQGGARRVVGVVAHFYGFDSPTQGPFEERLKTSELDELISANTRPDVEARVRANPVLASKVTLIDIAPYLAQAIRNYQTGGTVKDMILRVPDKRELYAVVHEVGG